MEFSKLDIPVSIQTVGTFIDSNTNILEQTLTTVREVAEWALRAENIVKIYGREDRQAGDKFKDIRKIAGKFNSYHQKKNNSHGNLWEIPDIIGFTIVVSYPSDLISICRILDNLVSQGSFSAELIRGHYQDDRKKAQIEIDPEFGRVLADRGYFGCHYNVRLSDYSAETPLCEIQIKTAMHDAWGAKTHDLIYKSPVAVDEKLRLSFEALGDVLSQIDWQSDLLKETLRNVSRVRAAKKKAINDLVMEELSEAAIQSLEESFMKDGNSFDIREKLSNISINSEKRDVVNLEAKLIAISKNSAGSYSFSNYAPFIAHYLLASKANDRVARRKADRGLAMWVEKIEDPHERAYALANAALFKFFNNDRLEAIEETLSAIEQFEKVTQPKPSEKVFERYWRRGNSISISLAYYFAEMIGTHDGRISNAKENSQKFLDKSLDARARISTCPNNALVSDQLIRECLDASSVSAKVAAGFKENNSALGATELDERTFLEIESNFQCLDCELFVRTQIADSVDEIEVIRRKLAVLHEKPPANISTLAAKLFQFHDYCVRQRLAELE